MLGGIIWPKGRKYPRVWFPCKEKKGGKLYINNYLGKMPFYNKELAERVLSEIRVAYDKDPAHFDPTLWLKDHTLNFQRAWEIYQEQSPCGESRMEARERICNDFFLPYFKNKSLREIEEHHVKEWWSGIPKTFKPSYLRVIRATLKAFLNFHKITRVKILAFPKITVPKKTPPWMTKDEQEKVFEFIAEQHIPIMRFLQFYGCRSSEACNGEKTHLDFEKDIITFTERKNDKDNTLPIENEIKPHLKAGKMTHMKYVFCTLDGQQYSRQVLYRIWSDANEKAHEKYGIKIMALKNGTRHSKANQLLAAGKSIPYVARWLGNSPSVIERNYGDISVETLREECAMKGLRDSK